jgi:hypothetical protein
VAELKDFRDPFALPEPLAQLRKIEWSMGNGQCPECQGLSPTFAYGVSDSGYHEPHKTGHKRKCSLADAIASCGQSVFYRRRR